MRYAYRTNDRARLGGRAVGVRLAAAVLIGAASATPAVAQQPGDTLPADTVYEVGEIRVRVSRPVATPGGAAAVATLVDSLSLVPSPTMAEVLRKIPLITVRDNSRGEVEPSIRGMESRQIVVLVDGIPITLGWDNRTDLSVVPATAAREMTLVRGLSSVLYGPNALGGAVLVEIDQDDGPARPVPPFQLYTGIDNLGNGALAAGFAAPIETSSGELRVRAGGGYRNSGGWPLSADVAAMPAETDGERINSDMEYGNGFVTARYRADGGAWASVTSIGYKAQKGVPPEQHVEEPRLWRYPEIWRWVTAVSGGTGWGNTPLGEGDLEAALGFDFGQTFIDEYSSLAYDTITGGESGEDRTLSFRLLGDHTLGDGMLRSALTLAESRHVEVIDDGDPATYSQRFFSLGLEMDQPVRGAGGAPRAQVSVGVSIDGAATPLTGPADPRDPIWTWGARAGGTLLLGDGNVLLNGGISRRVRFPALRELYSGALGRFVVNPGLDPEVLGVAELGVTFQIGQLEAQAVSFYQRLTDAIVRVSVGDGQYQRQNRDRITSAGLELLFDLTAGRWSFAGDATLQNVELTDPTAPAEQHHPEYQPWISGGLAGSLQLGRGFWTSADLRYVGQRYCVHPDLGADVELAANTWLDLVAGKTFEIGTARRMDAFLALDNATDSAVYDQCGLPRPGRLLRFEVRIF